MPNTDKTIFLPQLQRYDQKIKGWADNKFLTKTDTPSLPKATATTLGGVKVGNGLNVTDDGVLSAEDDIVFTWDFDTSAFSCNKTFAEVKKIITTGVRRTATVNGLLENFSITLLAGAANDNGVMFFGTAPGDALGSGMLGSRTDGTITYLFQKGLVILYNSNGQIQMTEDLSNLNTNMSFDFKNTTFQYDRYDSFDLKDGGITSAKLADGAVTTVKIADGAITADKLASGVGSGGVVIDSGYSIEQGKVYVSFTKKFSSAPMVFLTPYCRGAGEKPIVYLYGYYNTDTPTSASGFIFYSTNVNKLLWIAIGKNEATASTQALLDDALEAQSTYDKAVYESETTNVNGEQDIAVASLFDEDANKNTAVNSKTSLEELKANADAKWKIFNDAQAALASLLPVQDECK